MLLLACQGTRNPADGGGAEAGAGGQGAQGGEPATTSVTTATGTGASGGRDGDGGAAGSGGVGGLGGGAGFGGTPACEGEGERWATQVLDVHYGPGQGFGQAEMPAIVLGPPQGAGCCSGSLDVVSLGNGGWIVLGFGGTELVDGPGADFVVFENPFQYGSDETTVYAEPATVEVSTDGSSWIGWPCTAVHWPWGSCAGWHPVYQSGDTGPLDPTNSGGDAFDLADVGLSSARFVRIVDRADVDGPAGVFDLDAVGIVHGRCP
jgi:hypothetical protein